MIHGLSNDFLYSALKIESTFVDDIASVKTIGGTAFFLQNKQGQICLITNRHVFDLNYKRADQKYIKFKLEKVIISGKKPEEGSRMPTRDQKASVHRVRHNVLYSQIYENDIACIINPQIEREGSEEFSAEWFITHNLIANREQLANKLSVCDFVAFPGYPPWYDRLSSRPILRTGAISSDPRYDYSHRCL